MIEFSFYIKKFITFFIEPYGILLSLLLIGIIFLFRSKIKLAKYVFLINIFLMIIFAYPPFSNLLVSQLENRYSKIDYTSIKNAKYIHVLANGHVIDNAQPLSSLITDAGTKRVLEGVILYKHIKDAKLIFTGYANKTNISNAKMNAKLAMALGVSKKDIILGELAKDTEEEAKFAKQIVSDENFILVTSATHMHRALEVFKKYGLTPTPAPTDFYKNKISTYFQLPTITSLRETQIVIHEFIGILWYKIKENLEKK